MVKIFRRWCDTAKIEIILTMNENVMFFIHWRLQGTKVFYHEQISHENIQR